MSDVPLLGPVVQSIPWYETDMGTVYLDVHKVIHDHAQSEKDQ